MASGRACLDVWGLWTHPPLGSGGDPDNWYGPKALGPGWRVARRKLWPSSIPLHEEWKPQRAGAYPSNAYRYLETVRFQKHATARSEIDDRLQRLQKKAKTLEERTLAAASNDKSNTPRDRADWYLLAEDFCDYRDFREQQMYDWGVWRYVEGGPDPNGIRRAEQERRFAKEAAPWDAGHKRLLAARRQLARSILGRCLRRTARLRALALYWQEATQRALCAPDGAGRAADKVAFESAFA